MDFAGQTRGLFQTEQTRAIRAHQLNTGHRLRQGNGVRSILLTNEVGSADTSFRDATRQSWWRMRNGWRVHTNAKGVALLSLPPAPASPPSPPARLQDPQRSRHAPELLQPDFICQQYGSDPIASPMLVMVSLTASTGTIGQPATGLLTSGSFMIEGGFWPDLLVSNACLLCIQSLCEANEMP